MPPTITASECSPDRGQGLARNMRVRWALEEVGQSYQVRLVSFAAMKQPAHPAVHPFGQIPTYEEGELALFESGAIVFHLAERHGGLLPQEAEARARAIGWARIGRVVLLEEVENIGRAIGSVGGDRAQIVQVERDLHHRSSARAAVRTDWVRPASWLATRRLTCQ